VMMTPLMRAGVRSTPVRRSARGRRGEEDEEQSSTMDLGGLLDGSGDRGEKRGAVDDDDDDESGSGSAGGSGSESSDDDGGRGGDAVVVEENVDVGAVVEMEKGVEMEGEVEDEDAEGSVVDE
jgi:hypothetical protein